MRMDMVLSVMLKTGLSDIAAFTRIGVVDAIASWSSLGPILVRGATSH